MVTVAVICECNPLHYGHIILRDIIRERFSENACIVALMSGNTVQRGELSVFPKYQRAAACLNAGFDVILELPCIYACGSAPYFAGGAVRLLDALGGIDYLMFGSENGSLDALYEIAVRLMSEEYRRHKDEMPKNDSGIRLAEAVYRDLYGEGFPTTPNDILGVEYLSSLLREKSTIVPLTYRRMPGFSAGEARKRLFDECKGGDLPCRSYLPEAAVSAFSGVMPTDASRYDAIARFMLTDRDECELSRFDGMGGGLSGCLVRQNENCHSLAEIIDRATGRRTTKAAVKRAILSALLRITEEDRKLSPAYAALLGCSGKGRTFLAERRGGASLSILTKPADASMLPENARYQAEITARADRLMALCRGEAAGDAIRKKPIIS